MLVTFLLMSYTKFARTIIDAIQFSTLTSYPSNSKDIVWALDGNVSYFRGKHVVLFILALFATIANLFFSMHILIMSFKNNVLACKHELAQPEEVNQIQGELDAEDDYEQGWKATCLALVHRCKTFFDIPLPLHDALFALLILFTATSDGNQNLNLFILLFVVTALLLYLAWNSVYNVQCIQILEGLALANMVFCSGGMIYANLENNEVWKSAIACISVGIAFLQFLGIVIHCIVRQCIKNFKWQIPTTVMVTPITSIEQVDSSHETEQLLSVNDWRETGINKLNTNGDSINDECEPLLAHAAPLKLK